MFYTSVPPLDHGLLEFPTNSYGGFAYRSNTLENPTTSGGSISEDPTKRFVTEHNLALFWRRLGLYPHSMAFPVPLLSTSDDYAIGTRNRPPGNIRADCALIRYRQRNLLAGELVQDDGLIQIWTVNDSSDHKQLLHYKLRFAENRRSCGRKNLLCLERAQTEDAFGRMDLDNEVLQLKAFNSSDGCGRKGLYEDEKLLGVGQHNRKKCFSRFPNSQWSTRVECFFGVRLMFRIPSRVLNVRWCSRTFVQRTVPEFCCPSMKERCVSWTCASQTVSANCSFHIPSSKLRMDPFPIIGLETVLVTSARRHTLIDRRMPCVTLLTMPHGEIDGADYSITTPAFDDPETGGRVFSLYSLTQTKKPALSHWSLMYHPNECLWSSLGSKYEMDSPRASIVQFNLHERFIISSWTKIWPSRPLVPFFSVRWRAATSGQGDAEVGNDDDYEGSFVMKPIDEAKMKQKALKQIADFQTARTLVGKPIRPHFFEGVQDELMAFNQSKLRQIVDLTSLEIASEFERPRDPNSFQNGASPSPSTSACCTYPFSTVHRISDECMEMEQMQFNNFDEQFEGHEDKLFSTIVAQTWQKTLERWQEAKEKRVKKELGLLEIGGEQPKSDGDDDGSDGGDVDDEEEEEAGGIR
uniref:Uncharacterized protein n=1 Tax=Globodera rostochiensis TaxID=31243 RepID=A0A914GZV9_GLORO